MSAPIDPALNKAALGFEQMMLQQLTQSMAKTTGADDSSPYASMIPTAFAQALADAGGIGLAKELSK